MSIDYALSPAAQAVRGGVFLTISTALVGWLRGVSSGGLRDRRAAGEEVDGGQRRPGGGPQGSGGRGGISGRDPHGLGHVGCRSGLSWDYETGSPDGSRNPVLCFSTWTINGRKQAPYHSTQRRDRKTIRGNLRPEILKGRQRAWRAGGCPLEATLPIRLNSAPHNGIERGGIPKNDRERPENLCCQQKSDF